MGSACYMKMWTDLQCSHHAFGISNCLRNTEIGNEVNINAQVCDKSGDEAYKQEAIIR